MVALRHIFFKDFVTLQRGFDLPKYDMVDGPYPVVGSTSVIGYHSVYKVRPPGVVMGRSGSLGEIQYVPAPFWPHNTSLWVRDFKGNLPRYVFYFLKTLDLSKFNSGAGVPTLNRNHLDSLEIRVHRLQDQRKIAAVLAAYDDLIENNTRRMKILEDMARAIYREWFVHFRFPGHEKVKLVDSPLGKIPEGWEVKPFTDEIDVLSGGTPRTSVPEYWGGAIPWATPNDIGGALYVLDTERKITELGLSKCNSKLYPPETAFITARGTVGRCALAAVPMAMSQTSYALLGRKGVPQRFVYLLTHSIADALKKNATGAVFDTIVVDTFRMKPVVFAPKALLGRFDEVVAPCFAMVKNLLRRTSNLRRARDLLLPKLISGELDVSDLDIHVADNSEKEA